MKKILVLSIMALALAGCCTNPANPSDTTKSVSNCIDIAKGWVCANRATIENYMAAAQTTLTTITTEFGSVIPVQYLPIVAAAQAAISIGENTLANVNCPTDQQTAAVASASATLNMARAKVNTTRMGMKNMKLIP